jgi:3-oxoacyl-[acyl-carrier-protein] synthase II
MGVAACQLAFQDAQLPLEAIDRERTGAVYGCDYIMTNPAEFEVGVRCCVTEDGFQFGSWAEQGLPKVTPLWLLKYLPNMPACHVAIYNDLRGPNNSITVREASANLALAEAYCTIQRGHADAIVSGATGTRIHPIKTVHVSLQEEVAHGDGDPASLSRPFDANRTGVVVGEGAASLVLEELECAEQRGVTPLAEVIGFGSSTVISKNSVADRKTAVANALYQALQSANLSAEDVGHVNAHGVSTKQGDRDEAAGIQSVFGQRSTPVPVIAPKSATGNMGAGSGALELVSSVMALQQGTLFPTQNYQTPDPDCPLNVVTDADTLAGSTAININVTAQGQASALVVRAM